MPQTGQRRRPSLRHWPWHMHCLHWGILANGWARTTRWTTMPCSGPSPSMQALVPMNHRCIAAHIKCTLTAETRHQTAATRTAKQRRMNDMENSPLLFIGLRCT